MLRRFDDLTERQQAFVINYVNNKLGDLVESYLEAGYKDDPKKNQGNAKMLLRKLHLYIEDEVHNRIGSHVAFALDGIISLAKSAQSETVKFNALRDILSRAGFDAPQVIETKDAISEIPDEQLRKEVRELIKKSENVKNIHDAK